MIPVDFTVPAGATTMRVLAQNNKDRACAFDDVDLRIMQ